MEASMAKRTGRKRHSSNFKAQVAMEAIKGSKTIAEVAASCGVHPSQVAAWKTQLVDGVVELFSKPAHVAERADEKLRDALYQQIGQLQMEISWLKKKL